MTTYHGDLCQAKNARHQPDGTGWKMRHLAALERFHLHARGSAADLEVPYVAMLKGWASYADNHHRRYESGMGDDGALGPEWERIGRGLLALLNGEIGGLDGGTIDGFIRDTLAAEGFDPNA